MMKEIAKAILSDHQEQWQQIEAHFVRKSPPESTSRSESQPPG